MHLIWFFIHLTVTESRCDPYRLVNDNFSLFHALNSLLLKLENKNTLPLDFAYLWPKLLLKRKVLLIFYRNKMFPKLPFLSSKNELEVQHLKDGGRKRPLSAFFYGIWWKVSSFRAYNVTCFVVIIVFSINMQHF